MEENFVCYFWIYPSGIELFESFSKKKTILILFQEDASLSTLKFRFKLFIEGFNSNFASIKLQVFNEILQLEENLRMNQWNFIYFSWNKTQVQLLLNNLNTLKCISVDNSELFHFVQHPPLQIGGKARFSSDQHSIFVGLIDHFQITASDLTHKEISQIIQETKPRFPKTCSSLFPLHSTPLHSLHQLSSWKPDLDKLNVSFIPRQPSHSRKQRLIHCHGFIYLLLQDIFNSYFTIN